MGNQIKFKGYLGSLMFVPLGFLNIEVSIGMHWQIEMMFST